MNADRFHFVLAHRGEGDVAGGKDGERRAVCGMDALDALAIDEHGFDIGNVVQPHHRKVADEQGVDPGGVGFFHPTIKARKP